MTPLYNMALPQQRNFVPKASIRPSVEVGAMLGHLKNPRLVGLYATAFIAMGVFVSMYNFFGFRAVLDYGLPAALSGLVEVGDRALGNLGHGHLPPIIGRPFFSAFSKSSSMTTT